jgi:hypothetical protein
MTGGDVRQVFEAILPQEAIGQFCRERGVMERQRKLHLGMLVRATVTIRDACATSTRLPAGGRPLSSSPGLISTPSWRTTSYSSTAGPSMPMCMWAGPSVRCIPAWWGPYTHRGPCCPDTSTPGPRVTASR